MSSDTEKRPHTPQDDSSRDTEQASVQHESDEKNGRDPNTQPFSNGFFDKDPITSKARAIYLKIVIGGAVLVSIAIFTVLGIYWGALWKTEELAYGLKGWVVDFDGGEIGSTVSQGFAAIRSKESISWTAMPADMFPNGPADLAHAVAEEKCWLAISVNPGATSRLTEAVNSANATYNGTLAVTAFTNEARNENAYRVIIAPSIDMPMQRISQQFASKYAQQLATRPNLQILLSQAPGVVTQPLWYSIDNLHPFDIPVAAAVDFVGLIYLLILSFIIANQHFNARLVSGIQRRLRLKSLLILRIAAPMITYFWISLMYSLLSIAFQVPFDRKFGHSGFLVYWMMSWCGMMSLGLALEAMVTLLTLKFIAFFLILWIISNVSVCYYPIEVLPSVFRYGYAAPFYNVSRTVRTIVFGTRNDVGLNFGIQIAWIAISCITLPLFQWLTRRREVAAWRKEREGRAE